MLCEAPRAAPHGPRDAGTRLVALPLEAIHKASAREKSIRHGHPSTLPEIARLAQGSAAATPTQSELGI